MDGSKRSGHGNAYFTGLGNNKRIVFFDNLVNSLEEEELEAVLAHELGHFKCKHVIKMLIATSIMSLIGFGDTGLADRSGLVLHRFGRSAGTKITCRCFVVIHPDFIDLYFFYAAGQCLFST